MADAALLDAPATDDPTTSRPKRPANPPPSPVLSGATNGMAPPQSALSDQLDRDRADIEAKTPTMPVLQRPPKPDTDTNPIMAWGQPAMLIATLGSLFTRQPMVNALNAAAGVMTATKEKDAALAKQKYDEWKVETDNAIKLSEYQQKIYDAAIKKMDVDAKAGRAEMQAHMDGYRDMVLKQTLDHEGVEGLKKLLYYRKQQTQAMVTSQAGTAKQFEQSVDIAHQLASPDPGENMDGTVAQLQQNLKELQANPKKSTPEQINKASDALQKAMAIREQVKSPDPAISGPALDYAKQAYSITGTGKVAAPGSAADLAISTTNWVLKQNPGIDPNEAKLKAQELIRLSKETGGLKPETAGKMVDFALDTGNWAMIEGWSRSAKDKEILAEQLWARAAAKGMGNEQINAMYMSHIAHLAEVRSEGNKVGGRLGNIEVAANDAAKTIPIAQDAFAKLPRGEFMPFNQLQALVASKKNSPAQAAAASADESAIETYARALNPNGIGRESEIAKLRELLNTQGASPESHKATLDQWMIDIKAIQSASQETAEGLLNGIRKSHGLGPLPAAPQGGDGQQPVRLDPANADAQYDALPPGARFVGPDGVTRTKP